MPERVPGSKSVVLLAVAAGPEVEHGLPAGRQTITTAFPEDYRERTEAGGVMESTPLGYVAGGATWPVDRTVATDQQLFAAQQRAGTVKVRRAGTGSGLAQLAFDAVVSRTLTLTPQGSTYEVTALKSGALDRTPQA